MKNILSLLFAFALLSSCSKDVDPEHPFSGEWFGSEVNSTSEEGHSYRFYFCKDNFKLITFSVYDYVYDGNGCLAQHYEYITGKYRTEGNKLILDGIYTDSLFLPKTTGCYEIGAFKKTYNVKSLLGGFQLLPDEPRYPSYGYGHDRFNISKVSDHGCSGNGP